MKNRFLSVKLLILLLSFFRLAAQTQITPDYSSQKTLQVIGTAHFDTQWRWTVQTSINEYVPNTMRDNFRLFEKYPGYRFSFEGAIKYMFMKEYYPADFERVKKYIAEGRWNLAGSSIDAGDVNIPSPEAIMRSITLGQNYFRKTFGKTSKDIFLPDCFGFGYALPSIETHCGLTGFSTQKLSWGSAYGIPFYIGTWQGVDGSRILAELNPGDYGSKIREDLSNDQKYIDLVNKMGEKTGLFVGYRYFGTGDIGGSPDDESVSWLQKSMEGSGPLKVVSVPSDLLSRQITPAQLEKLPLWNNELLATTHGTGCYTAQAIMKRWNRKNELLADDAERAAVVADWLGGTKYPKEQLNTAWVRFIWHTFHDDLTGTSIPEAYAFSWNDEILSLNQFGSILENAAGAVGRAMNTTVTGMPVMVYNPLSIPREDIVETTIEFGREVKAVLIFDKNHQEIPSQVIHSDGKKVTFLFQAKVPPLGFEVYDLQFSERPDRFNEALTVTPESIENERYRVRINADGDIASVLDKNSGKDLLQAPVRLGIFDDQSRVWPAWEIQYRDIMKPARAFVDGDVKIEVVEKGPVRASLKVTRRKEGSVFVQYIRLGAGSSGDQLVVENEVQWNTMGSFLKAVFPLASANPKASYDLGLGVIERGNNLPSLYEVPAQQWADLSSSADSFGVSILNDCKYGWDKPNDNTLRLTLIHTPDPGKGGYSDQATMDLGNHVFTYAIYGHRGGRDAGNPALAAARLNQPLVSFLPGLHKGALGNSFSLLSLSTDQVLVKAVKKAEESDEIIIRLQELKGKPTGPFSLSMAAPILSAREMSGAEEPLGNALTPENGMLKLEMKAYQPRTIAVKLGPAPVKLSPLASQPLSLPYDLDVVSRDSLKTDGDFSGTGINFPAELFPEKLTVDGIPYSLGKKTPGAKNALACNGNKITLPGNGKYSYMYVLAASSSKSNKVKFLIDNQPFELEVPYFSGWIAQWDSRLVDGKYTPVSPDKSKMPVTLTPGYIHRTPVAWVSTHLHDAKSGSNLPYVFGYMFRLQIELPFDAKVLTLPKNPDVKIFAITLSDNPNQETRAGGPLYDQLEGGSVIAITSDSHSDFFNGTASISINSSDPATLLRYTTNGSDPDENSSLYQGPFQIQESTLVRARAWKEGKESPYTAAAYFSKAIIMQPDSSLSATTSGVNVKVFKGTFHQVPDYTNLFPELCAVVKKFEIYPDFKGTENFAQLSFGVLKIEQEGLYTFSTVSDDGSMLLLNDQVVVDNDGDHGSTEARGAVWLKKGLYRIAVKYYQGVGDDELKVYWQGPGMEKQEIPATVLFNSNTAG